MRCLACDCELNGFESTRKYPKSTEYIDLCNKCFSFLDLEEVSERYDLEGDGEKWKEEVPTNEGEV